MSPGRRRSASGTTLVTADARLASTKIGSAAKVSLAALQVQVVRQHPVLCEQKAMRSNSRLRLPGAATGEGNERRARVVDIGNRPISPESGRDVQSHCGWHPPREGQHDGHAAQGGRPETEQVCPRGCDESGWRGETATAVDIVAPCRRVEKHRDAAQPPQADERGIQRDRHGTEDQHAIPGPNARPLELHGHAGGDAIELGERDTACPLDDGWSLGAVDGALAQHGRDIHGSTGAFVARPRANSAYRRIVSA